MFGWIAHGSLVAWLVTAPGTDLERALLALWISATITDISAYVALISGS